MKISPANKQKKAKILQSQQQKVKAKAKRVSINVSDQPMMFSKNRTNSSSEQNLQTLAFSKTVSVIVPGSHNNQSLKEFEEEHD